VYIYSVLLNIFKCIFQAKQFLAEQDYISTSDSDGIGNGISYLYDIIFSDNFLETQSLYSYYMNLAASLGTNSQVELH